MKKTAFLLSLMTIVLVPGLAMAEEPSQEMRGEKGMMKPGKMHQQPTVVATSDGGVVILQGPKLIKYDAQLNLVGEVEMKKPGPPPAAKTEESAVTEEAAG